MRVETFVPYALDKNLGAAYNRALDLLGRHDWAIFIDHDAMPTTSQWYRQVVEAIHFRPEAAVFAAMANRIAPQWQQIDCVACARLKRLYVRDFAKWEDRYSRLPKKIRPSEPVPPNPAQCGNCHDIRHHRELGEARLAERTLLDITDTLGWGGVAFAVSKRAWAEAGGFADGMLCCDHSLHFRLQATGRRSYLLESLYFYHWRRAFRDRVPDDTPVSVRCPCTGSIEKPPTDRIRLP